MSAFTHAVTLLSFEVFVGTEQTEKPDGSPIGLWLDLSEYRSKDEFLRAAKELVIEELSGVGSRPNLRFYNYEGGELATEGLISKTNINGRVWEYLSLESWEAVNITRAFESLYGDEAKELGSISKVHEVAIERSCGHGGSIEDFGYDYLEAMGYMENLPAIIEAHIDITALSTSLLTTTHKTCDGWYFANQK